MVNSTSVLMIFTSIMLSLIITELKAIEISTSKSFWCILKRPKLKPGQKFVCGQFWANIEIMPTLSLGQVRPMGPGQGRFYSMPSTLCLQCIYTCYLAAFMTNHSEQQTFTFCFLQVLFSIDSYIYTKFQATKISNKSKIKPNNPHSCYTYF